MSFKYQDWLCPDCNENNFGRNDKCRKCDCYRSKARSKISLNKPRSQSSQPPKYQPSQPSQSGYQPKPGDWLCVCGFPNWAKNKECKMCNLDKPNPNSNNIDKECKICMDQDINAIFLPCGHVYSCISCAEQIFTSNTSNCPVCREPLSETKRIYQA